MSIVDKYIKLRKEKYESIQKDLTELDLRRKLQKLSEERAETESKLSEELEKTKNALNDLKNEKSKKKEGKKDES